ncbi:MAG: hypothetical protein KatS3mg005_1271 [Bryobacteraceae bacterium]|nr:MAG: hypothetical protein KatS3mg005_1271 [Bryobacteraceae bacterium]
MELVLTGGEAPRWDAERVADGRGGVRACAEAVRRVMDEGEAEWVLFWDGSLGAVPEDLIRELIQRSGDVWHGGLDMGLKGRPELFDFVTPCWMLHGDPEEGIEASSWRVSLRCCLIRRELLRVAGGLDEGFVSMEAAGLDLGYRCLCAGAMMRFVPGLSGSKRLPHVSIPLQDEARLVAKARGRKWLGYALARAAMTGYCGVVEAFRAYMRAKDVPGVVLGGWEGIARGRGRVGTGRDAALAQALEEDGEESVVLSQGRGGIAAGGGEKVTVLVPTVDRYPYLKTLMGQLARQTVRPHEVIVVDQTERERRHRDWQEAAAGLPLRVIEMDEAGQCSSRNAGLQASTGDWVLFLDDDDEVALDLIERFLKSARETGAEVVCGVADEAGGGELPAWFQFRRVSDVFPTNAGMVRRDVFVRSGLFDLAYNRGARADGDLGTRMFRSGAKAVLDPSLRVFHHHAPRGGLRRHKARVATYAASRQSLWVRQLPEATELYLKMRFYSPRQVRESLVMSVLGTFSVRGPWWKRLAKAGIGLAVLPWTIRELRKQLAKAREMLEKYPKIEGLRESCSNPTGEV